MQTSVVDWTDVDPPRSASPSSGDGSKRATYLKMEAGKSYVVRPVGKAMSVCKYFHREGSSLRTAIVENPDECPVRAKHPDLEPKQRYAINVIDRADGEIKILEAPPSVFKGFKKWFDKTGKNPGNEEGGDFGIDVEIPPGGTKLQTRYDCQFIEPSPFTDDEFKQINGEIEGKAGMYKLPEVYKPHSTEEIEKLLFGEKEEGGSGGGSSGGSSGGTGGGGASTKRDLDW